MRVAYKVILTPEENGSYTVFVPDFNSGTQGKNLADAMYMARDLIGIMGITHQDMGKDIPVSGVICFKRLLNHSIEKPLKAYFYFRRKETDQ